MNLDCVGQAQFRTLLKESDLNSLRKKHMFYKLRNAMV